MGFICENGLPESMKHPSRYFEVAISRIQSTSYGPKV